MLGAVDGSRGQECGGLVGSLLDDGGDRPVVHRDHRVPDVEPIGGGCLDQPGGDDEPHAVTVARSPPG